MTGVVIVNRKGVQMRTQQGRYAPKIVPPAVAASIGRRQQPNDTSGVVQRQQDGTRSAGQGVYSAPAPEQAVTPHYQIVGKRGMPDGK